MLDGAFAHRFLHFVYAVIPKVLPKINVPCWQKEINGKSPREIARHSAHPTFEIVQVRAL